MPPQVGVEDVREVQRLHRRHASAQHIGEGAVGEENAAVLADRQHGYRKALQHNQGRHFLAQHHRRLVVLA
jgi:hypothetical protein